MSAESHIHPLDQSRLGDRCSASAVELAVSRFDEHDIAALRGHLETMKAAASTGRRSDFAKADIGFHTELFERIGHRRLLRVWQSFVETYRVILEITDTENPDLDAVVLAHQHILDAIERRDAKEARRRDEESLRAGQADFERRSPRARPRPPRRPKGVVRARETSPARLAQHVLGGID
jgi:DNA-binding GntR family transcriptional regulator